MPRYGKSFKSFQRIIPSLKLDVTCSPKSHQKPHDHKNELKSFDTRTLQLLSVFCIETSHYVCFTRITGSGKDEWVFFDSMAERQSMYVIIIHVLIRSDQQLLAIYTIDVAISGKIAMISDY